MHYIEQLLQRSTLYRAHNIMFYMYMWEDSLTAYLAVKELRQIVSNNMTLLL